jgi:tetratricopeptide (TPR) repeat protein
MPTEPLEPARLFREAIEIEPAFAQAWAELALVEIPLAAGSTNADRKERSDLARQMAERAIQLDPTVVAGYAALGTIQFYNEWDFAAAEQTFRTALAIDPSDGFVRQRFSMLLAARGRLDEAIPVAQECVRLEPSLPLRYTSLGTIYYYARDNARAQAEFRRALAISPGFPVAFFGLGLLSAAQGRYDEAIGNVQRAIAVSDYIVWQIDLARIYAKAGRTDDKNNVLAALSNREKAGETYGIDHLGYIAAAEGRVDDAFHFLDQAVSSRTINVLWMMVDPRVDVLRSDPRFEQLLTKAGLRP